MKEQPIIKNLIVPDHVLVDMRDGSNYVKVPVSNLDASEVEALLDAFVLEFCTKAGMIFSGVIEVEESEPCNE